MSAVTDTARAYKAGDLDWSDALDAYRAFGWVPKPNRRRQYGDDGDPFIDGSVDELYDVHARGLLTADELSQALEVASASLRRNPGA